MVQPDRSAAIWIRVFSLCFVLAGSLAVAGEIETAKKQLAQKQYDKVDETLTAELKKAKPAPEALRISLDAALASGRFVTAQKRVSTLLREAGTDDVKLLLQAARIAMRAGDRQVALQRYKDYLGRGPAKGPELKAALEHLLQLGPYPDWYKQLVDQFGASEATWSIGNRQLVEVFEAGNAEQGMDLAAFLMAKFPQPVQVSAIHRRLRDAAERQQTGRSARDRYVRPLQLMVKSKPSTVEHMLALFQEARHNAMQPNDRVMALLRIQSLTANPLPRDVFSAFSDMRKMEDEATRLKAGKAFLALESIYQQSPDKQDYYAYLKVIVDSPEVFALRGQALVAPAAAEKRLVTLLQKYGNRAVFLEHHIQQIHDHFMPDAAAKAAFLKKFAVHCAATQKVVEELLQVIPDEEFPAFLKSYSQQHGLQDLLDLKARELARFNRLQDKAGLLGAARDYMNAYPGAFDANLVSSQVIQSDLLTPDEKLDLVKEVLVKAGASTQLGTLIGKLSPYKGNPKYGEVATLYKAKKPGTDVAMAAHVAICSIPRNQNSPQKEVLATARDFVGKYNKPVPGGRDAVKSVGDATAHEVFVRHLDHVYNNSGQVFACAELWAPQLQLGDSWVRLVARTRRFGGYSTLDKIAPEFVKHVQAGEAVSEELWDEMSYAQAPRGSKDARPVFAPLYGKMGAEDALRYVDQNRDSWERKVYLGELAKVLALPDLMEADWFVVRRALVNACQRCDPKNPAPAAVAEGFWKYYTAARAGKGMIDLHAEGLIYGIYARSGLSGPAKAFHQQYGNLLKQRTPVQQIAAHSSMLGSMPRERTGILEEGHRAHKTVKEIYPLLKALPRESRALVSFRDIMRDALDNFIKRNRKGASDPDKQAALAMRTLVGQCILDGARSDNMRNFLSYVAEAATVHAAKANLDELGSVVNVLPDILAKVRNWDVAFDRVVGPLGDALEEKGLHEVVYVLTSNIEAKGRLGGEAAKKLALISTKAAGHIKNLVSVAKTHQAYNLHMAQEMLARNNPAKAWEYSQGKLDQLPSNWQQLNQTFVAWLIDRMRLTREEEMQKKAIEYSRHVLLQEKNLEPEVAADIALIQGDVFRDQENFQAARIQYESLMNNERYKGTTGANQARFRLVELHIMTGGHDDAERMLERLLDSAKADVRAEAFYYLAVLRFAQEDYDDSERYIKEVRRLAMNHERAALLEGEIRLKKNKLSANPEVIVGNQFLATTVVPGKDLVLKLRDPNLGIIRGGSYIPVEISTTSGNDKEKMRLFPSDEDPTLFKGEIRTAIGKIEPGNTRLEILGLDQVQYIIDEEYQKANGLHFDPKFLEVKYSARLVASSGEILTEEEQEERELQAKMRRLSGQMAEDQRAAFERRRDPRTIRPGSKIYAQVRDFDMDVSDEADKVRLEIKTSSGDLLDGFELTESEAHSGIFRGEVPTGMPFPKASASDTREGGADPSVLINSRKTDVWESFPDGKKPKSVIIDTMTSVPVSFAALELPEPASIKKVRLEGSLVGAFEEFAAYPEEKNAVTGGVQLDIALDRPQRDNSVTGLRNHLRANLDGKMNQRVAYYNRDLTTHRGRRWLTCGLSGYFFVEEAQTLEFKFLQRPSPGGMQTAYFLVDGATVLGGTRLNADSVARTRRIALSAGVHRYEVLLSDYNDSSQVIPGYKKADGTFEPLPPAWFSVKEHPELADALKPKATLKLDGTMLTATFTEPVRVRKLRWAVEDYAGESVKVKAATIKDDAGKVVVPQETDFTSATENRVLEIAPGDRITVSYNDAKNTRDDDPVLMEELNASFYNGEIELVNEMIRDVPNSDRRQTTWFAAERCSPGDQVVVRVIDWDLDLTDKRDQVKVQVASSGGEKVELTALETSRNPQTRGTGDPHAHAGEFVAILKVGEKSGKDTIGIKPGETVTALYVDKENTDPGIPIEREASMVEASGSEPEFLVYRTHTTLVEDTSPTAKAKLDRLTGSDTEDGQERIIYKTQVVASHPNYVGEGGTVVPVDDGVRVSVNAPLLFELYHPAAAKHAGSKLRAQVASGSELKAAEAEGREPAWTDVELLVNGIESTAENKGYPIQLRSDVRRGADEMLASGYFAGVVRLQLGKPGDPIDDLVVRRADPFSFGEERRTAESNPDKVPTIIVSGADTVRLRYTDEEAGKVVAEAEAKLLSDARFELLDRSYTVANDTIYLGERFYMRLTDTDQDATDERDTITVKAVSSLGDALPVELTETLEHSGIFTANIQPAFLEQKRKAALKTDDDVLNVYFGDTVDFEYVDPAPLSSLKPKPVKLQGKIRMGTDGQVAAFSKRFSDPEMAVKTRFLMAEALFEMAKEFRKLSKPEEAEESISKGKNILEEALRDYPNTSLAAQGEFLLANLAQENKQYDEAIGGYSDVINRWPDSEYAARSQFKKGICFEKKDDFDAATEEYVKLTYLYPESPLVQDATVRLGNYYYRQKQYRVAARIFHQFQKRFQAHRLAAKALFLAAQCYMKMENYKQSATLLEQLVDEYRDDPDLRAEAMYWQAESYFKGRDVIASYQTFKKLTWDYPDSKWAKIARGRLTDDAFARIEE